MILISQLPSDSSRGGHRGWPISFQVPLWPRTCKRWTLINPIFYNLHDIQKWLVRCQGSASLFHLKEPTTAFVFVFNCVLCYSSSFWTSGGVQMLCWLSSTITHYTSNCWAQCYMSGTLSGWYHVVWSWHYPHSWTKMLELLHLGQKLTPILSWLCS